MSKVAKVLLSAICLHGSLQITQEPDSSSIFPTVEFGINSARADDYEDGDEEICEEAMNTSVVEFADCKAETKDLALRIHGHTCVNKKAYTVSAGVTLAARFFSGFTSVSGTTDNYTKCKNQLDYSRDASLAHCEVVRVKKIAKNCN